MARKSIIALVAVVALACGGCGIGTGQTTGTQPQAENKASVQEESADVNKQESAQPEAVSEEKPEAAADQTTDKTDASQQAPETESAADAASPVSAETMSIVKQYGSDANGYSNLSYSLDGSTLKDEGDYYTVTATFAKPIPAPENPQMGESYDVVYDEINGITKTLTCIDENNFTDENGSEVYTYANDGGKKYLYEFSDDRIDCPFYVGTLAIRKDAVTGAAITNQTYETVTTEDIGGNDLHWFNGVKFDGQGYVTELIFFGD